MKALVLFFGGLVVWGAVTGKSAGSGGPPTAATEIPTSGGHGALFGVLVVVVGLLALLAKAGGGGRAATGRMVSGHAHGPSRTIARHEAGHVAAVRAVGGRVVSANADADGGLVRAVVPDVRASVTFLRAGRYAAGTSRGCSGDEASIRAELRDVPRSERGRLLREADRDARRIVRQHAGQIRRDAATLGRRGTL